MNLIFVKDLEPISDIMIWAYGAQFVVYKIIMSFCGNA